MFGPAAAHRQSRTVEAGFAPTAIGVRDAAATGTTLLERYLEGWAEVNPGKIFAATTQDYCFNDPLVGQFSHWSVRNYLERLRRRFGGTGTITVRDLAVFIRGPMGEIPPGGRLMFYREAPALGLTGVTCIAFGEHGVISERVSYDLNLASDLLRGRT